MNPQSKASIIGNVILSVIIAFIIGSMWYINYTFFNKELLFGVLSNATVPVLFLGSIFAVLSHVSFIHVFNNLFIFLLSMFLLSKYLKFSETVTLILCGIFGTAMITWNLDDGTFGVSNHVGASGLSWCVLSSAFFLLRGNFKQNLMGHFEKAMFIAMSITMIYCIPGLFPNLDNISWQMHLGGLLTGLIFSSYILSQRLFDTRKQLDESVSTTKFIEKDFFEEGLE